MDVADVHLPHGGVRVAGSNDGTDGRQLTVGNAALDLILGLLEGHYGAGA